MANNKPAALQGSPRERLLAAANELFYAEGVHSVGIDRVIERAGVAKASLYSSFGSKDELVRAYLQARALKRQKLISESVGRSESPRARILAVFEVLGELTSQPNYRGCAFVNASAERAPGESKIDEVCQASRAWVRNLFSELGRELGASEPEALGRQLALLYDGVSVRASMDRDASAAADARGIAEMLLDSCAHGARDKGRTKKRAGNR